MVSVSVTPGRKYDFGRTPCVGETLRRTLKHLFFEPGFAVEEDKTLSSCDLTPVKIRAVGHTLSRISTRFTASTGVSGGGPFGDCSARSIVEMVKGISCVLTPSLVRSSGVIGGKSDEDLSPSVHHAREGERWDSL